MVSPRCCGTLSSAGPRFTGGATASGTSSSGAASGSAAGSDASGAVSGSGPAVSPLPEGVTTVGDVGGGITVITAMAAPLCCATETPSSDDFHGKAALAEGVGGRRETDARLSLGDGDVVAVVNRGDAVGQVQGAVGDVGDAKVGDLGAVVGVAVDDDQTRLGRCRRRCTADLRGVAHRRAGHDLYPRNGCGHAIIYTDGNGEAAVIVCRRRENHPCQQGIHIGDRTGGRPNAAGIRRGHRPGGTGAQSSGGRIRSGSGSR